MEEEIQKAISAYLSLKEELGEKPSSREFFKVYPKRNLYKAFEGGNAYSRLQELAGDSTNVFSSRKSDLQKILLKWGELARKTLNKHGKLPISADWSFNKLRPSVSGIEKSHKVKWSELPYLFHKEFSGSADWEDVLNSIRQLGENGDVVGETEKEEYFGYVYLMKSGKYYTIGKSDHTGRRSYEHERKLPEKIKVIHKIKTDDPFGVESYWDKRFQNKKTETKGSWYKLDANDIKSFKRWKKIF